MKNISRNASMLFLLLLVSSPQRAEQNFKLFFPRFQHAVLERDIWALAEMMSPKFQFFQASDVSPEEVFILLDADDGREWANLEDAVLHSPVITLHDVPGKQRKALQCTPTLIIYNCYLIFELNDRDQWRWKAMIMPPKY